MRLGWVLALSGIAASAPQFEFNSLKWRNIGPNRGGRSQAVAGSAKRPLEYYFGAVGGGLWKTTNGGITWFSVTDGQIRSSSVGAVAVSESNPDVVYIGMGETELRGNIMQGDGVYKSSDGGKTWKHLGLEKTQAIARIRVHPTNPDIVFVAALGHPYGPNPERGVLRSTDGGATWKRILYRNEKAGAIDICIDPKNPLVIFASLWEAYRTPWTLSSGGPGSGLFKSTDGGDTWTEITRNPGLPRSLIGKITISVSGIDNNRVYAFLEAEDGGLFRSDDAGATWTRASVDANIRQRAFYFGRIQADPIDPDTVYAMNVEFYRSRDGGKTFQRMRTVHADHHDLWIAPDNPLRMIGANDGGGAVSTDGGETWSLEQYPTAQLYHVVTTNEFPYHVCGAQQDNTTVCVSSVAAPHTHNPEEPQANWMYPAGGGEAGYVASDPRNPNIFFGGDQAGIITRYDRRTGEKRVINVYPMFFSGIAAIELKERWQWTFPIVFSPVDPNTIYTSSQHLWKTTTDGQRWEAISPDLTRNAPVTLGDSGGPITKDQNGPEIYGTIFSIAPSRHDVNVIWTGSDDGLVYLTRDCGKNWANVTPPGMGDFNRVSMIEASPYRPGGAYVAAKRYQLDDRAPYLFKTDDYGKTWKKIVDGIQGDDYVQSIREDIRRPGLLFAGTEHGIYVSFNNGGEWQSLRLNLPDTQVTDLAVEKDDLVIATHGRSFYILDDIGILRQFTPEIRSSKAHLFAPRTVTRGVNVAAIDYHLGVGAEKVAIEILDDRGQLVRRLDGASKPGANRSTWDLRYPGSTVFPGIILRYATPGQGPTAPPGKYTVRLLTGGVVETQPLVVERDLRLSGITDRDLIEQFRLAMQIAEKTSEAHQAVIRIRSLRKSLDERAASVRDAEISRGVELLKSKLAEVEGDLYQTKLRSPRDVFNYPIKIDNQLAVLQQQVDTGNAKPTDQDYAAFQELSGRLAEILDRLRKCMTVDLDRLNETLKAHRFDPIQVEEKRSHTAPLVY